MNLFVYEGGEQALKAWGLATGDDTLIAGARLIGKNNAREVRVLEEAGKPTLFVKLFWNAPGRSEAEAEARIHQHLRSLHLSVARPLATATREDGHSVLILQQLPGVELDLWFQDHSADATAGRKRLAERLGQLLRDWHAKGVVHGQLFSWHILVSADLASISVLDVSAARVHRRKDGAPWRGRARDLASVFTTLPMRDFSSAQRCRLLRAYGLRGEQLRRAWPAVRYAMIRQHRRGRFPRSWPCADWRRGRDKVQVHEQVRQQLPEDVSKEFVAWCFPKASTLVRQRDGRSNLIWDKPFSAIEERWYGKRFDSGWRRVPASVAEFWNHAALDWLSIPHARVTALARRKGGPSILWTRAIVPGDTVRDLLHAGALTAGQRTQLSWQVMDIVRRLHRAGFCHRDCYLDHFLLDRSLASPRVVLIDLGRLQEHVLLPVRRRVKDLASLEYSARTAGVSRSDRLRAYRQYEGPSRGQTYSRSVSRKLLRQVVKKADAIQAREQRKGRYPVPLPDSRSGA